LVVLLWCSRAWCETPEAEARRRFEQGTRAYALGEFQRAITEYRAAYNAKPHPAILYNIGQAYRFAGDLPQALFFYRSYLTNQPNAPNRRDLERRIHDLEARVQAAASRPSPAPLAAAVQPPSTKSIPPPRETPPAGDPRTNDPEWSEPQWDEPSAPARDAVVLQSSPSARQPAYKKWWVWTLVGVGAAGLAVGLGVGLTMGRSSGPSSHFGTMEVF
jgi:tetratricopeptide (TPR) repeat protein